MSGLRNIAIGLRSLFRKEHVDRELNEELAGFLETAAEEKMKQGMNREDARRAVRLEQGNAETTKEVVRSASWESFVDTLWRDLRFGLRMLGKNPGFTAAAVLTLALGIGANAAVFGFVDSAFLRGLPFREPERLVHIWTREADGDLHTPTPAQYQAVRNDSGSFAQIAAAGWADYFYEDGSATQNLAGLLVSADWLPTLGVQPLLGRNFRDEEQMAGGDAVVIVSYDCWRTRFQADPHILGKQIVLNRRPVTVVGVLPRSFGPYYEGLDIFAPLVLDSYASQGNVRAGKIRVQIIARLKPGVTLEQARSEADVIATQFRNPRTPADRSDRLIVEDFVEMLRHPGPTRQNAHRGLWMTAVASAVVLLVACANVAEPASGSRREAPSGDRRAVGSR